MAPFIEDTVPSDPRVDVNIIDIRTDQARIELKGDIKKGLDVADGVEKTLPTMLLYDERGLKLFEKITYLDEYYLTGEEIELLERHAADIANRIPDNAMLVELGSGNLRKIKVLLDALENAAKTVEYFALDLDRSELERTLTEIAPVSYRFVQCSGLHGTYDDGLVWLNRPEYQPRNKVILSLGSSIGNFDRDEAAAFIDGFVSALGPNDSMLVAIDACQDHNRVFRAYNDANGVTKQFTMNGLDHANTLLGHDAFERDAWDHVGNYDDAGGRHQAFLSPNRDLQVMGVRVGKGERVKIEESYKYSLAQREELWRRARVSETAFWHNDNYDYGLHMIGRSSDMFATTPEQYAAHPVPKLAEWQALWKAWDIVTRQMIPQEEMTSKPIKLRNACIFYLGHIPTFADMKISQALGKPATEPASFHAIFERGIDPDVDNPEHCHAHSEIPDEWPPLADILQYQERVRARITDMYDSGEAYKELWTGRVLWLSLEHEAMHLETLLYMLIQSDKVLPPQGVARPDFAALAARAEQARTGLSWVDIPEQTITLGMNDPDNRDGPLRHFGWDCEKPERTANVHAFKAASRPITNLEYAQYLLDTGSTDIPASWADSKSPLSVDGISRLEQYAANKSVKTVFGAIPLSLAFDWPVAASFDELAACAAYMGGRIPTLEEARSLYEHVNVLKQREALQALQGTIPAVNSHLINEGVQESPPEGQTAATTNGDAVPSPNPTFADLSHANVGFKHWHPLPVTALTDQLAGQAEMGGIWEWTSSPLVKQAGFEPMELYPAYSADFFDDKHNIVLGGSWATHPRLAGRKSFINWYQRNYPYVWAGARLVKDL